MVIAVGVLAFGSPDVLEKTVAVWPEGDFEVFVHVDSKADLKNFSFLEKRKNCRVLSERKDIKWGGFEMVEAEIALIRAAYDIGAEYYINVSDHTVPLQSPAVIQEQVRNGTRWRPYEASKNQSMMDRYRTYVCYDVAACNPIQKIRAQGFKKSDFEALDALKNFMEMGKADLKGIFHSSQWKAIRGSDLQFIVEYYDSNQRFKDSFRYSVIPDESYIPTILGSSDEVRPRFTKFMFADFEKTPRPYVFSNVSELEKPRREGFLFARKVKDGDFASKLMDGF